MKQLKYKFCIALWVYHVTITHFFLFNWFKFLNLKWFSIFCIFNFNVRAFKLIISDLIDTINLHRIIAIKNFDFILLVITLYTLYFVWNKVSPKGPYFASAACWTYLCFGCPSFVTKFHGWGLLNNQGFWFLKASILILIFQFGLL